MPQNLKKATSRRRRSHERGIALVVALVLLMLLTVLGMTMYVAVNSDMLINGYYRNFRGGFYGADSGLNIMRQELANRLLAKIPASFDAATQPIAPGVEIDVQKTLNAQYGGATFTPITAGQAHSWPAKYQVSFTDAPGFAKDGLQLVSCTVQGGGAGSTCAAPINSVKTPVTGYTYTYNYHLMSYGRGGGSTQKTTLAESGTLSIVATLQPTADSTVSFAAWGMFIDKSAVCDGSTLVPGTISGPVFTNGAWNFGTSGQYIFTDTVGSAGGKAGYQFSNGCEQVAGGSDSKKIGKDTVTIAPTFASPLKLGQAALPLPTNDYNQQRAVLDGVGSGSQPSKAEMHAALRNVGESKYPTSGPGAGVWLPYDVDGKGVATFTGGGIYVEGDANITLTPGTNGTQMQQIYTVVQGTGKTAVTTVITVNFDPMNPSAGSTQISSGGNTVNINGVPVRRDPDNPSLIEGDATMLYVNGNINSLAGPGQAQPAIQDGTALTVAAAQNVTITGDVLYKTEPVTLTQNQIPGTAADTLIPGNDKGQSLGIYTAGGDIQLKNSQANGNLQIDASLASIAANGTGGLVNVGSAINKLTIVGGRIQNSIKNINATTRNVFFDRRYGSNNFAPPWFPSTTISHNGMDSPKTVNASFQRLQWLNQTSF
jgi:Tfp pilus assembly protein PilX